MQADVFRRNAEQLAAEGDEEDVALVGAILDVSECCTRVQEVRQLLFGVIASHVGSCWSAAPTCGR